MGQSQEYEALIRELLAGVAGGWSYGNVIVLLMTKGVDEEDLALWLRDFAEGLSLDRDGELIEQLKILGKMTPGKLASEAFTIIAMLDSSYEQSSELLNYQAWYGTGYTFAESGKHNEAIASYDMAIELKPDNHEAFYNRGLVLDNLERYEDAIDSYRQAIEIKPDKYQAWCNQGVCLNSLGKYDDAIESFDRAIEIKSDRHDSWASRAIAIGLLLGYQEEINLREGIGDSKNEKIERSYNFYTKFLNEINEEITDKTTSQEFQEIEEKLQIYRDKELLGEEFNKLLFDKSTEDVDKEFATDLDGYSNPI